jgi:hypothetical protein
VARTGRATTKGRIYCFNLVPDKAGRGFEL